MIIGIVLTLQEVPLRYNYYCGLPLQYYRVTIVWTINACLKEKIKNTVGLFCVYRYRLSYGNNRKISAYCWISLILLKWLGCNNIYILLLFNFLFVSNLTISKWKSLCLKTIVTIAIVKRLLQILLTLPLSYRCSNIA